MRYGSGDQDAVLSNTPRTAGSLQRAPVHRPAADSRVVDESQTEQYDIAMVSTQGARPG